MMAANTCKHCRYLMTLESVDDETDIKYICTANPEPIEKEESLISDYTCRFYKYKNAPLLS